MPTIHLNRTYKLSDDGLTCNETGSLTPFARAFEGKRVALVECPVHRVVILPAVYGELTSFAWEEIRWKFVIHYCPVCGKEYAHVVPTSR